MQGIDMKIKSEKGITNIDITVSIILITLFVAIIATLMYNINANSGSVERRSIATNYAINEIESLKAQNFDELEETVEPNEFEDILENEKPTGYAKKVTIIDYANLEENKDDDTIVPGLVKKVTVEISYKDGNTTQTIDLSTVIAKNS